MSIKVGRKFFFRLELRPGARIKSADQKMIARMRSAGLIELSMRLLVHDAEECRRLRWGRDGSLDSVADLDLPFIDATALERRRGPFFRRELTTRGDGAIDVENPDHEYAPAGTPRERWLRRFNDNANGLHQRSVVGLTLPRSSGTISNRSKLGEKRGPDNAMLPDGRREVVKRISLNWRCDHSVRRCSSLDLRFVSQQERSASCDHNHRRHRRPHDSTANIGWMRDRFEVSPFVATVSARLKMAVDLVAFCLRKLVVGVLNQPLDGGMFGTIEKSESKGEVW